MQTPAYTIAVLITCFNRRELTLTCLQKVYAAAANTQLRINVTLVDDGSTDGTADAVRRSYPDVDIVHGNGQLYWNRGMHAAWTHALKSGPADFYLWLNDDTHLHVDALVDLFATYAEHGPKAIVVGRIADPVSGEIVYGGMSYKPDVKGIFVVTDERPYTDTFNGNCVLIPASAVADIGIIDPLYWHAMGDADYGFRATAAGYRLAQVLRPVAFGSFNVDYAQKSSVLTPRNWRFLLFHPKGRRPVEAIHFFRKYVPFWLPRVIWYYVKIMRLR